MGDIVASIKEFVVSVFLFFQPVWDFVISTKIPDQIENIKYEELFKNVWFLVPYLALLAWNAYQKQVYTIIIILLLTGSWAFFGTPYMQGIMHQDEIPLDAVLPLAGGGCLVLGVIVYLIFFKAE